MAIDAHMRVLCVIDARAVTPTPRPVVTMAHSIMEQARKAQYIAGAMQDSTMVAVLGAKGHVSGSRAKHLHEDSRVTKINIHWMK